jgi:hypothetical protein
MKTCGGFNAPKLRKLPVELISKKNILFLLPTMQKKVKISHLLLFIPVLFWLVAKPISLFAVETGAVKTEKTSKQSIVKAEQNVYQSATNLQLDFPQDWNFTSPTEIFVARSMQAIKLPTFTHRTQFLRILFTQFIATLAP